MNRFLYDNGFRHERFKAEFYIDKLSRYLDRLITPINVWKLKTISARLTPSCIILQNGQIYLEKSCGVNHGIFLKYVWAFLNIMHERINVLNFRLNALTLSWRRSLSCRNQSIDLLCEPMDWFLYDKDFSHKRVKSLCRSLFFNKVAAYRLILFNLEHINNVQCSAHQSIVVICNFEQLFILAG